MQQPRGSTFNWKMEKDMTKAKINLNLIHIHGVKGKHLPVISDPRYFSFLFLFSFSFFFFFVSVGFTRLARMDPTLKTKCVYVNWERIFQLILIKISLVTKKTFYILLLRFHKTILVYFIVLVAHCSHCTEILAPHGSIKDHSQYHSQLRNFI